MPIQADKRLSMREYPAKGTSTSEFVCACTYVELEAEVELSGRSISSSSRRQRNHGDARDKIWVQVRLLTRHVLMDADQTIDLGWFHDGASELKDREVPTFNQLLTLLDDRVYSSSVSSSTIFIEYPATHSTTHCHPSDHHGHSE